MLESDRATRLPLLRNIRRGKGYSVYEGGKNGEQTAGEVLGEGLNVYVYINIL